MLWGREVERAALGRLIEGARAADAGVLVVRGDAGIGKTALVRDVVVGLDDVTVLWATGEESEAGIPFAGLVALLRPLLPLVDDLPGPQRVALLGALALGDPVPGERLAVAAGVLTLLARAAEDRVVACVVDDFPWLDPASREAVLFAARRLDADRVAVILCVRTEDEGRVSVTDLPSLEVGGLDEAAALEVLRQAGGHAPAPGVVREITARTGGNPLGMLAVASVLDARQALGLAPLGEYLSLGAQVRASVGRRLVGLPEATRQALVLLSVAGAGDEGRIAEALSGAGLVPGDLDPAEDDGLLVRGVRPPAFAHPLTRSAVHESASAADLRAAHIALAEASSGVPERQAWHRAAAAGAEPDDAAADALEQMSGISTARGDLALASDAMRRAGDITTDPLARAGRYLRAGELALAGGADPTSALAAAEVVAAQVGLLELRMQVVATRFAASVWSGKRDAALLSAAREIADAAPPGPAMGLASLLLFAGWADLDPEFPGAVLTVCRQVESAIEDGVEVPLFTAGVAAWAAYTGGGPEIIRGPVGMGALERSLAAASGTVEYAFVFPALFGLCVTGAPRDAQRITREELPRARDAGAINGAVWLQSIICLADRMVGDLPASRAAGEDGLHLARLSGLLNPAGFTAGQLAITAAVAGDDAGHHLALAEARRLGEAQDFAPTILLADCAAGIGLAVAGHLEEATARLDDCSARVRGAGIRNAAVFPCLPTLAECLIRLGRTAEARDRLVELESLVPTTGGRWVSGAVALLRGMLANGDEIDDWFDRAAADHASYGGRLEEAYTRLVHGERLRREKRTAEARQHLTAAFATFDDVGARPWAERCVAELRAAGQRVHRRSTPGRGALTPQEYQVAVEVAARPTNTEVAAALFLSRKTVEMHLTRVYRKLGVRSRVDLANYMMRHDHVHP